MPRYGDDCRHGHEMLLASRHYGQPLKYALYFHTRARLLPRTMTNYFLSAFLGAPSGIIYISGINNAPVRLAVAAACDADAQML